MLNNYKICMLALFFSGVTLARAEEAPVVNAPPQSAVSALPSQTDKFWDKFAFEVGYGVSRLNEEDGGNVFLNPSFTLGLGGRVGEGVLLLRYNQKVNLNLISIIDNAINCSNQNTCEQLAQYDEYGLVYRQKFGIVSLGLGPGLVRRSISIEDQNNNVVSENTSTRGALFYELMLHAPISRKQHMSMGFGFQGQYNKDYPSLGFLVTFQKGL